MFAYLAPMVVFHVDASLSEQAVLDGAHLCMVVDQAYHRMSGQDPLEVLMVACDP